MGADREWRKNGGRKLSTTVVEGNVACLMSERSFHNQYRKRTAVRRTIHVSIKSLTVKQIPLLNGQLSK